MVRSLVRLILKLLYRVEVRGSLPPQPPARLLIIANHQSLIDPFLLGAFLPFRLTWVVHSQIWARWYFRLIVRWAPHVVVDPAHPHAVRTLIREIEAGRTVAVFPEGRITVTGALMKVYDGPAFLAAKTGAAILPVYIDGPLYTPFSRMRSPFPKKLFPKVTLTVLPLEYLPMPDAPTGKLRRQIAGRRMRRLLERMCYAARKRQSIPEAFLDAVRLHGRRARILDDVLQEGRTYNALLKASLALRRLVARRTAEGETLGVLMPNTAPTVALLLGMWGARRTPAMLNYSAGIEGMQSACVAACIRKLFTSRAFLQRARLDDKIAQLSGIEVVYLEDLTQQFRLPHKLWLLLWALWRPARVFRPSRPNEPAIVLFTSGSEGEPKGVVLSHDSILANVAQLRAVIEFSNRDKFLTALPMFHAFGLTAGVLVPLLSGCRLFLYPSPLHFRMIPEIAYDRDCTVLLGTPSFLARYGAAANPYDFYRVRYVVAGAEKLTEEVRQLWIEKFGIRLLEGYGATECSPVLAVNTPFAWRADSVGRLLPGIEHWIEPLPGIERGGCLHVRGDNVMLGYLRRTRPGVLEPPASTAGEGWYNTGDVVEIDPDGFLFIIARLKRFAKVAGEMVSLETAERIAAAASPKLLSAATAIAQPGRGESIVLFTQDPNLRREHLLAAARELGLPELAVPRRIHHIHQLPRLGSGKVNYVRLKTMAEEIG